METTHNTAGHETTDVSVRPIILTGAALATMAAVVFFIVYGIFWYLDATRPPLAERSPMAIPQVPPEPRIEDHPTDELHQLREYEEKTLTSYGWADKKAGAVRIPIDRAIELQLQRGYPVRKEALKK